ncbi:ScbA/BarX family gamma-butyrolactone biosynthesis protein [Streptomyces sp. NPDC057249]|uniref:ScbA/BarX family gamma-butyrolactone biosynthesis protein n=1 Tax=Streptomyces sp. NPDC057249 TaxID=3346067 RepID=UPI00362D96B0
MFRSSDQRTDDHGIQGTGTRVGTGGGEPANGLVPRPLDYLQPVPRHMVHRAAVAEVFVTDSIRTGEDRFLVAAQWPRDHALYSPSSSGISDPLLLAETVRQSLVYLAHRFYGVPLTHRFVGSGTAFRITRPELLRIGDTPLPVVLDVQWEWVGNRPPRRYGMRLAVVLTIGGEVCGEGEISAVAVNDRTYRGLRGAGAAPADTPSPAIGTTRLPSSSVGRLRTKDSVLGLGADGSWQLLVDLRHAIYFDHPSDHVPLMVMLEGFRQLGHLLANGDAGGATRDAGAPDGEIALTGMSVDCRAFGELDAPISLVVSERQPCEGSAASGTLTIEAVQNGTLLATCLSTWASSPSLPGEPAVGGELTASGAAVVHGPA